MRLAWSSSHDQPPKSSRIWGRSLQQQVLSVRLSLKDGPSLKSE